MELWKGKVAVVTGSSAGIGAAICKELCKYDVIVVGIARRLDRLEELKKEIQEAKSDAIFHSVKCDISNESEIKSAFETIINTHGGVDILINNAAIIKETSILDDEDNLDALKQIMETNVFGLVSCTKKAFKSMSDRDAPGYIINISSVLGYYVINFAGQKPVTNMYPASKHALRAMNTVLRHELNYLQKNKIRVSSISPGAVKSEMTAGKKFPSILESEDVADAVVYLLGTNPRVQIEDIIIRPTGEIF